MTIRPDSDSRVRAWLGRAFLLQVGLISIAAVVGVFIAGALLERSLIRAALTDEVAHFWRQRDADPRFQLPNTRNLRGYFHENVPAALRDMPVGNEYWEKDGVRYLVNVTERNGQRLYLVFDRSNVNRLATYYGLVPLAGALLVLYVSAWFAFHRVRRAVSPMIALARKVRELEADPANIARVQALQVPDGADDEVRELTGALLRYSQRLALFLERERQFTRDASHELRSPLTVIRMAASLLLDDAGLTPAQRRTAERIQRACQDMEALTHAFLLLARETETGLPLEAVCVNEVLVEELERARTLAVDKPVTSALHGTHRLYLDAPEQVVSILLGNLLRNAFLYTESGEVTIHIGDGVVIIRDTGVGIPADEIDAMFRPFVRGEASLRGGHGVGLTIVQRLSDRFGWPVRITSERGVGTTVEVSFPDGRSHVA